MGQMDLLELEGGVPDGVGNTLGGVTPIDKIT